MPAGDLIRIGGNGVYNALTNKYISFFQLFTPKPGIFVLPQHLYLVYNKHP